MLQAINAALLVVLALALARGVSTVVAGAPAASVITPMLVVAGAVAGRSLVSALTERFGVRAGIAVIGQVRAAVLEHVRQLGPAVTARRSPADLTALLTTGLDQLDGYLVRYLPQLLATAIVTPSLVVVVFLLDPTSAWIMIGTIPLIPLFMALVGWTTQRLSDRRIVQLRRLGDQVLDLVAGLPTLSALGRARAQAAQVREVGDAYRRSTMSVLRVAFISGFVLEFLATLSVALVAVGIGMRLVFGYMDLVDGLAVLILAPEVYLPLRLVGLHFHASTDGAAAARSAFELLDEPVDRPTGRQPVAAPVRQVAWTDVTVQHGGRSVAAPSGLTGTAQAGRVTALVGPNGSGKSTAVAALLGLIDYQGQIHVGAQPLTEVDGADWHRRVAWLPQHPVLVPGTLADNLEAVLGEVSEAERDRARVEAGLDSVVAQLPDGWHTRIGTGGVGLSAGQRQRLALARAVIRVNRGAEVVILDEPTAHLDSTTEAQVIRCLRGWAAAGLVVIVVAHRPSLQAVADDLIPVGSQSFLTPEVSR